MKLSVVCHCKDGFKLDANGTSLCKGDCNGKPRSANELECRFPFLFNGTWYDKCTNTNKGFLWCSLDLSYAGFYARCEQECPKLARISVLPDGQSVHITCWNKTAGWAALPMTNTEINLILKEHNGIRGNVSVSASKMRSLSWDWGLARGCQRLAENGVLGHFIHPLLNNKSSDVGQNLYLGAGAYSSLWARYSIRVFFILLKIWN